jgi:hypothetical protein
MIEESQCREFAPARRSSKEEIERQVKLVSSILGIRQIVRFLPDIVLIVNENRQIVYANSTALRLMENEPSKSVYGMRPGELLDCVHVNEYNGGCCTSAYCNNCGAVRAILSSIKGHEDVQECRIVQRKTRTAMDLRVWAFPLEVDSSTFLLVTIHDISTEKQKRVLERMFFHDIMNTVTSIQTYADILQDAGKGDDKTDLKELISRIGRLSNRLIEEIKTQRELISAENNELEVHLGPLNSVGFLRELAESNEILQVAQDKKIIIDPQAVNVDLVSDEVLLSRIVGNMIKNALEAISSGQVVTLGCEEMDEETCFWVHNPGFIPYKVQLEIFQRSFSTKGPGRGLGTYSMRLLGEHYLRGNISFTSSEKEGTVFQARFPRKPN